MEEVELYIEGKKDLYINEKVFNFITNYDEVNNNDETINPVIKKLNYFAEGGFRVDTTNIRNEGNQAFRIRVQDTGRIIGFYDASGFIAIDCYIKNTRKLTQPQKNIIDRVSKIKSDKSWRIRST